MLVRASGKQERETSHYSDLVSQAEIQLRRQALFAGKRPPIVQSFASVTFWFVQALARLSASLSSECHACCCCCMLPLELRHCAHLTSLLSYGGSLVYDGSLSGGGFVAFCFVAAQVTMAAAAVPLLLADTRRAAAAARRVVDVLQRQPRLPHRGGLTLQSVQGRVTWRGVSLRRPPHDVIVDADVDAPAGAALLCPSSQCCLQLAPVSLGASVAYLDVQQSFCALGLLTAIVGEAGSGGLSLALLATRMESPTSGCVALDDTGEIMLTGAG